MPVLETITPEMADSTDAPRENESILRNDWSDFSPTATLRTTLTLHQTELQRPQGLENKEEDNMPP